MKLEHLTGEELHALWLLLEKHIGKRVAARFRPTEQELRLIRVFAKVSMALDHPDELPTPPTGKERS